MTGLLYIDLFCGAGGTSTGVNAAVVDGKQCAKVIACVNHDKNAIASHASNHPDALHFTEDIRTLELSPLIQKVEEEKKLNPGAYVVLWASLECTNFSKAKGGMARDADSRTLAEHLFRYIDNIRPDFIQIENVEEFMSWGELDANGKPLSYDKGNSYIRWINNVKARGYNFDYRILNAADFGAYTSRKRYFAIFAKNGLPIVFPTPTHDKNGAAGLKKWKAVKDVLNFGNEGSSIFGRKRPLAERTLQRIYAGLIKFVAGGKDAFLCKYNSMSREGYYNAPGIDDPCPVVATQGRLALVHVSFLSKQYSGDAYSKNISVSGPAGTVTTKDHHALVRCHFLDMQYGNGRAASIQRPSGTLTTRPKENLVTAHFLMNPQFESTGSSVNRPSFTLIARMDKKPPYLVSTTKGNIAIEIYDSDSEMTKKIKEFMALYGIIDVTMRMLEINELKKIMGFPDDYVLFGTKAEQMKFIGNAVEVHMATALCRAIYKELFDKNKIAV